MMQSFPVVLGPRAILDRLVSFATVSRESNLALVDWVQTYLESHGVVCHRHWNAERTKAALMAHAGPMVAGAVVLSGHSDVVPVDGQTWTTDPWVVAERDRRLYGRGTCDMKGFVAQAIWALVAGAQQGLRRPLQLALSFDEEVGCTGAPGMIAELVQVLPKGDIALIGEPSMMRVINGHKGGAGHAVHLRGVEVHSSRLPYGVSAVMQGARLIDWANQRNAENAARAPTPMAALFDPPFTTLHVGMVSGGTAHNITAADCRFALEMRVVPGERLDDWAAAFADAVAALRAEMQAIHPDADITLTPFFDVPPLIPEQGGGAEALLRQLTGDNASGVVSYGTEAGQFQQAGYSAAICGPGDIAQAHQGDEYLTVAQFDACHDMMQRLIKVLA